MGTDKKVSDPYSFFPKIKVFGLVITRTRNKLDSPRFSNYVNFMAIDRMQARQIGFL